MGNGEEAEIAAAREEGTARDFGGQAALDLTKDGFNLPALAISAAAPSFGGSELLTHLPPPVAAGRFVALAAHPGGNHAAHLPLRPGMLRMRLRVVTGIGQDGVHGSFPEGGIEQLAEMRSIRSWSLVGDGRQNQMGGTVNR